MAPPAGQTAPARRPSAGLVTGLLLGVLVLLCAAGGTGAYVIVTRIEGRGANTPAGAVDAFLRAVYVDRDGDAAQRAACTDITPGVIDSRLDEADALHRRYDGTPSWDAPRERSRTKAGEVLETVLRVGADGPTQHLRLAVESSAGWRVCALRTVS